MNFNGLIAKAKFIVGKGGFIENGLSAFAGEQPKVPVFESATQEVVKEPSDKKAEVEIEKSELQVEYSVEVWFRWELGDRNQLETIYVLKGRDKVLGLHQNKQGQ